MLPGIYITQAILSIDISLKNTQLFPVGEGDAERGNGEQARRRGLPVRAGVPHPSPGQSRRRGQEGKDIQNSIVTAFFVRYWGINYAIFWGWG